MADDELAAVLMCPDMFDDDFTIPDDCRMLEPLPKHDISCIDCTLRWLHSEVDNGDD